MTRTLSSTDLGFSSSILCSSGIFYSLKLILNLSTYIFVVEISTTNVYFDDKDSLSYKVALAKSRGLLGVGVWALGYEGGYYDIWDIFAKR